MKKLLIYLTILTLTVLLTCPIACLHAQQGRGKIRRIMIDPGHGGSDPGCLGRFSKEKDIALAIALEVGSYIRRFHPDVEVQFTRTTDVFIPLNDRARMANRMQADFFLSIHCNASVKKGIYGTETYIMGTGGQLAEELEVAVRENSVILQEDNYMERYQGFDPRSPLSYILMANYQNAYKEQSFRLANKIEQQFSTRLQRLSRGVKQSHFLVLARTSMPGVLIEVGFLSNPEEELFLNTEEGQTHIAGCIYRAFRDYKNEVEDRGK